MNQNIGTDYPVDSEAAKRLCSLCTHLRTVAYTSGGSLARMCVRPPLGTIDVVSGDFYGPTAYSQRMSTSDEDCGPLGKFWREADPKDFRFSPGSDLVVLRNSEGYYFREAGEGPYDPILWVKEAQHALYIAPVGLAYYKSKISARYSGQVVEIDFNEAQKCRR